MQQQLAVGIPEIVEHILLDVVGDLLHFLGLGDISRSRIRLGRGVGVGPHVGRAVGTVHALSGTSGFGEGDRIGVVTGHRPPGPVDQAVLIIVLVVVVIRLALRVEQALDVLGTVVAQRLGQRGRSAVNHIGIPAGLGDVLRIAVVPVGWVARIVVVIVVPGLALLGGLAGGYPSAVRIFGIAQPLGVVDEHAGRQHDLVVVSEDAFDGCRILEGVARHVGVEHVEAAQPPTVEDRLVDVVFRSLHVRNVLVPPLVVGGYGILVGSGRIGQVAVEARFVFGGGIRQLVGDQAQLQFGGLALPRLDAHCGHEFAVFGGKAVAGEPRVDGGQIVLDVHSAGQFGGAVLTVLRERRGRGHLDFRVRGADHGEVGDHHVVVGDVLDFRDLDGSVVVGEYRGEVAGRLLALVALFLQRDFGSVDAYGDGETVVACLVPVGRVADEAQGSGLMVVHVCGAATTEEVLIAVGAFVPVFSGVVASGSDRIGAFSGKHFVDPEIVRRVTARTIGKVLVEDLLQITGCGYVRNAGRRNRVRGALETRIPHIRIRIGCVVGICRSDATGQQCCHRGQSAHGRHHPFLSSRLHLFSCTSRHWLIVDETRVHPRFLTFEEMRSIFSGFGLEHPLDENKYTQCEIFSQILTIIFFSLQSFAKINENIFLFTIHMSNNAISSRDNIAR